MKTRLLCRSVLGMMLCGIVLLTSVTAFVIGGAEDLEALQSCPENSEPVPRENLAPIAQDLRFTTYRNVAFEDKFLAFDPDGDALTARLVKKPARGSIAFAQDGSLGFTYTPYENKCGKDSFEYVVEDDKGNVSEPAKVFIRIEKQACRFTYADMAHNPAHKAAIDLANREVFVGQQVGGAYFFQPEQSISRAEFLTLAMQSLDVKTLPDVEKTSFSDDASIARWAKPYVATALQTGMVQGTHNAEGNAVFEANRAITKAEASAWLDALLCLSDVADVSKVEENVAVWAVQPMANLDAVGVLGDASGAEDILTMGEVACMLSSAVELLEARNSRGFYALF